MRHLWGGTGSKAPAASVVGDRLGSAVVTVCSDDNMRMQLRSAMFRV